MWQIYASELRSVTDQKTQEAAIGNALRLLCFTLCSGLPR
jgi:hypothetical protein